MRRPANTEPWGWIAQPSEAEVKTWWKPDDWNLVTATTAGAKVTVTYNGLKSAESSDPRLPKAGKFGFQVHAGMDCGIWVDDVGIQTVPPVTLMLPKAPDRTAAAADARDFPGGAYRTLSRSGAPSPAIGFSR